jgi:2-phospho-L-lactate guanylyltransferase
MHADSSLALWLIVPVKPFGEGKSRLADVLPAAARAALSRRWLTHVLTTVRAWNAAAPLLVISRDPAVLAHAAALGAQPLAEPPPAAKNAATKDAAAKNAEDTLNAALAHAQAVAQAGGAEAILALPADLPLLTAADLDELYDLAQEGPCVVLAPSHDRGTNALLLRPPGIIPFAFGPDSFIRHAAAAGAVGLPCHVYHSVTLALDVDHPEDLLLAQDCAIQD